MTNQKEDIFNYLGTILFVGLFIFFVSAFSNKPINQTSDSVRFELKAELNPSQLKAIALDAIQLTTVQKSCLYILYNANLNLFNTTHKILVDNSKVAQHIVMLKKTEQYVKPILLCRFYYQPISAESDEIPILS
jgi:hypothetical protein